MTHVVDVDNLRLLFLKRNSVRVVSDHIESFSHPMVQDTASLVEAMAGSKSSEQNVLMLSAKDACSSQVKTTFMSHPVTHCLDGTSPSLSRLSSSGACSPD
jgi:hypothetical protein